MCYLGTNVFVWLVLAWRLVSWKKLQSWWQHTPDWSLFFFFFFLFSSTGSSWLSESETYGGTASVFLFLCCGGSSLLSLPAFLFFFTCCCAVCPSDWPCLSSVKLCFCFSFAFCCSLASNSWDRDSFEVLASSSSPRYLWAMWHRTRSEFNSRCCTF